MMNRQVIINAMEDCRGDTRSFWVWMHGYLSASNVEDEDKEPEWIEYDKSGPPWVGRTKLQEKFRTKVQVKFRGGGKIGTGYVGEYCWRHDNVPSDIIAYRILDE